MKKTNHRASWLSASQKTFRSAHLGLLSLWLLTAWLGMPEPELGAEELRLFFNPGLERVVCEKIDHSRESLDVEMYDLSGKAVLSRLENAQRRGVQIRVILCPTQESNLKTAESLRQAGTEVRWYPVDKPGQKMHLKMGVIDKRVLLMGSPNWTHSGLNLNHEGLLVVTRCPEVNQAAAQFEADWTVSASVCPATSTEWDSPEENSLRPPKAYGAGYAARCSRSKPRSQSPAKQKSGSKL
jgi:phosphatidylserine/phosphatidylglycerophosphate/cardiolipin synthase-like enzyme